VLRLIEIANETRSYGSKLEVPLLSSSLLLSSLELSDTKIYEP